MAYMLVQPLFSQVVFDFNHFVTSDNAEFPDAATEPCDTQVTPDTGNHDNPSIFENVKIKEEVIDEEYDPANPTEDQLDEVSVSSYIVRSGGIGQSS